MSVFGLAVSQEGSMPSCVFLVLEEMSSESCVRAIHQRSSCLC